MSSRTARILTGILPILLLLPLGSASAHNNEYQDPEAGRPPPRLQPPAGPVPTPGSPTPTPGQGVGTPRARGVPTPGHEGPRTATPDSVEQARPLSWKVVWELLRSAEPLPPPPPDPVLRGRVRAALRGALEDESEKVRRAAVLALGRLGDLERVCRATREDPLLHDRPEAYLACALALPDSPTAEDAKTVGGAARLVLEDPKADALVKACAGFALGRGGSRHASALLAARTAETNPALRTAWDLALGWSRHPGAREILVTAVLPPKAGDAPARRAVAVHALSLLRGEEIPNDLLRRLSDESSLVRSAAILSLGPLLDDLPAARSAIRNLAREGESRDRSAALLALARAGDPETAALCRIVLRDRVHRDGPLGGIAALCLGLAGAVADGPGLLEIFADPRRSEDVRAAAALGAGLLRARGGSERYPEILEDVRDPELRAWGLLGYALTAGESAAPDLIRALEHERSEPIRRLLVIGLGRAGGNQAREALVVALGDSFYVNLEAAPALFRVDPGRAVDEVFARLADGKDETARTFAARVFGRMFEPRTPGPFAESLLGIGLAFRTGVEQVLLRHASRWLYDSQ